MLAIGSSLNKIIKVLESICNAHQMKPSFGYGPISDFNASNDVVFPIIWVEALESRVINTEQGLKVAQLTLNLYALDRIDKGDSNFLDIHSDMNYLLQTIVGFIRESDYTRDQYIMIDSQDQVSQFITRETDENCNGLVMRLILRMPDVYTPCNSPFEGITASFPTFLPSSMMGTPGPQGSQGPQGPQGFDGPQGSTGSAGVVAVAGPTNSFQMNSGLGSLSSFGIITGDQLRLNGVYTEDPVGGSNTFIGISSGANNDIGSSNTFIGNYAGFYNSSGNNNTFIGVNNGYNNIKGNCNTFIGFNSGTNNTSGMNNTFMGFNSGRDTSFGCCNTFIGDCSGMNNTTGCNNTFIGSRSGATSSYSGSIAIGSDSTINNNGELSIGSLNYPIGTASSAGVISYYLCITVNGIIGKVPIYFN